MRVAEEHGMTRCGDRPRSVAPSAFARYPRPDRAADEASRCNGSVENPARIYG
jgi:hypothetical protein